MMLDVNKIRLDFPILRKENPILFFDNSSTTLKPDCVIQEVTNYYCNDGGNVGRGDYDLAIKTEIKYEKNREIVAEFIGAKKEEIIFCSGASDGLNFVAKSYGSMILNEGDVILTTKLEHASNLLPWFQIAKEKNAKIEYIELENGRIKNIEKQLHSKIKVIVITHISNVFGYINDIEFICRIAHSKGIKVIVDGAQSVAHIPIDVKKLNCDFFVFSGHKMLGPTGIGVIYGKKQELKKCLPIKIGGGSNARYDEIGNIELKSIPYCFECGTPAIEANYGLAKAIEYLQSISLEKIHQYELELKNYLITKLKQYPHIEIYNEDCDVGIISLNIKGIFAQDVASYLNSKNIAVRSGQHCAKLTPQLNNIYASVRISLYFYNTFEELDILVQLLSNIKLEDTIDIFLGE